MDLILDPSDHLTFELRSIGKVTALLRIQNPSAVPVVWKIKTTQPSRYLVAPNQGILPPGGEATVEISLQKSSHLSLMDECAVDPKAIDGRDKFLVQSSSVSTDFHASTASLTPKDAVIAFWAPESKFLQNAIVRNQRFAANFVLGAPSGETFSSPGKDPAAPPLPPTSAGRSPELADLRRKYDELVSFSVNLTAERDILENSLEQAKRDLNREMARRMNAEDELRKLACAQPGSADETMSELLAALQRVPPPGGPSPLERQNMMLAEALEEVFSAVHMKPPQLGGRPPLKKQDTDALLSSALDEVFSTQGDAAAEDPPDPDAGASDPPVPGVPERSSAARQQNFGAFLSAALADFLSAGPAAAAQEGVSPVAVFATSFLKTVARVLVAAQGNVRPSMETFLAQAVADFLTTMPAERRQGVAPLVPFANEIIRTLVSVIATSQQPPPDRNRQPIPVASSEAFLSSAVSDVLTVLASTLSGFGAASEQDAAGGN